jgi:hypothetical protein
MDTAVLVENLYTEGKKLIESLDKAGYKYPIALLMKNDELEEWNLIFGIPDLNATGSNHVFRQIHKIINEKGLQLSLNDIKLLDTKDPLCRQLRMIIKTGNEIGRMNFFGNSFNGTRFPDSILYRVN